MATLWIRGKKKKIYLRFRWQGRQFVEPTMYECEKSGEKDCKCRKCKSAAALGVEIERRISENSFKLQDYFPNSKALKSLNIVNVDSDITFTEYAQQWLELVKPPIFAFSQYKSAKSHVRQLSKLINLKLKDIRNTHIKSIITYYLESGNKPKTVKNKICTLSSIFNSAVEDRLLTNNPAKNAKLPKVVREPPDPFEFSEINKILLKMQQHYPELVAYFALGFYSGIRTGEILALEWEDIDFNKMKIRISKTMTEGRLKQGTKTNRIIDIDIIPTLLPYIQRHKRYTFLMGGALFRSKNGEPIRSYDTIVRRWRPVLKLLGIRYRQPYQMRHTFAVMMINAGEDLNWIKNQLGHSTLEMLLKIYGNWYNPNQAGGMKFQKLIEEAN